MKNKPSINVLLVHIIKFVIKFRASVILVIMNWLKGHILYEGVHGAALISVNRFDIRPQFLAVSYFLGSHISANSLFKTKLNFRSKFWPVLG